VLHASSCFFISVTYSSLVNMGITPVLDHSPGGLPEFNCLPIARARNSS
jgi:hypothetical protein